MTFRLFEVHFPQKTVEVWERIMPTARSNSIKWERNNGHEA